MKLKIAGLLFFGAYALGALAVHAQAVGTSMAPPALAVPIAPASFVVSVTPSLVSQYMFRGQRLSGTSFQPVAEATYGNFGLGVWSNFPIQDKATGASDPEIDPYGYYTVTLNNAASVVPGFTLYTYPNADLGAGFYRTTFEPSLALNYTVAGVKLTPKIYYDVTLVGPTLELTAAYAWPLKNFGTELDFGVTYGEYRQKNVARNSSPDAKAWGSYWSVGGTIPYQITRNSRVIFGFAYVKGENAFFKVGSAPKGVNALAMGRGVVSVNYAWTF